MNISNLIKQAKNQYSKYETMQEEKQKQKLDLLKQKNENIQVKVQLRKNIEKEQDKLAKNLAYLKTQTTSYKITKFLKDNKLKKREVKSIFNSKF